MQAPTPEIFNMHCELLFIQFSEYETFLNYFKKTWLLRKELWSKAWRQVSLV